MSAEQQAATAATEVPAASLTPILPGATIGMLGGGQLGRMFALAARRMGYRVVVLTEDRDGPAAQVADAVIAGPYSPENLDRLASECAVVTLEFENIPDAAVRRIAAAVPTHPSARVLATAQDGSVEKQTMLDCGLPVTPFRTITDLTTEAGQRELTAALAAFGFPVIVKRARSGYDGKGQRRLDHEAEVAELAELFGSDRVVVEQVIPFRCEISAIVARNPQREAAVFPIFENRHAHHIL